MLLGDRGCASGRKGGGVPQGNGGGGGGGGGVLLGDRRVVLLGDRGLVLLILHMTEVTTSMEHGPLYMHYVTSFDYQTCLCRVWYPCHSNKFLSSTVSLR